MIYDEKRFREDRVLRLISNHLAYIFRDCAKDVFIGDYEFSAGDIFRCKIYFVENSLVIDEVYEILRRYEDWISFIILDRTFSLGEDFSNSRMLTLNLQVNEISDDRLDEIECIQRLYGFFG